MRKKKDDGQKLAWLALDRPQNAFAIAHKAEKYGRGDIQLEGWQRWWYPPALLQLGYGFAQLAKGRIDECRAIWRKALAEHPDQRWFRAHLDIPVAVLERMARKIGGPAK